MVQESQKVTVFLDATPNLLKHPVGKIMLRKTLAQSMHENIDSNIDKIVDRYAFLPALTVHYGEYCKLLSQARDLFVWGYFYSCVTMCGIVAERIVKDIFSRNLLVVAGAKITTPNQKAKKDLESFGAKEVCEFLIDSGVLNENLWSPLKSLGELRNKYAHAGGKKPEEDARKSIKHLHSIVDGTVSVFREFAVRHGKLVRKKPKTA
ncbi:hypothetical protein ES702_05300 [subsurface metagenome]